MERKKSEAREKSPIQAWSRQKARSKGSRTNEELLLLLLRPSLSLNLASTSSLSPMRRGSAGQQGAAAAGGGYNNDAHRSHFGRSASSLTLQFSRARFRHNDRVALALLPALAVVAGSADAIVLWVLLVRREGERGMRKTGKVRGTEKNSSQLISTIGDDETLSQPPPKKLNQKNSHPQAGAAITYMLDAAGARQATLLSAWATLAGANAGLLLTGAPAEGGARPLFLTFLAAAFNAATLLATGCWATLQFRWVQRQHPAAVLSLEKGLLSSALPLGAAAAGLVFLTALSPAAAPFGTSAALFVLYFALCVPLRSSFVVQEKGEEGGAKGKEATLSSFSSPSSLAVTRASALRGAALFVSLPPLQYLSMHRRVLRAHSDVHGWALLLLASFPLAAIASSRRGLWFLEKKGASGKGAATAAAPSAAARAAARRAHRRLRRALLLVSCSGTVAGLEGRVLLRSAGQYLALPSPWAAIALGAF